MGSYNQSGVLVEEQGQLRRGAVGAATWNGRELTVPLAFTFPAVCLKCGAPHATKRRSHAFNYTPNWMPLLMLLCLVVGAVVFLFRKHATLVVPLCERCEARWKVAQLMSGALGLGIVLIVMGVGAALGDIHSNVGAIVGFSALAFLVALLVVMSQLKKRTLSAKKIDDTHITLVGVSPEAGAQVAAT